MLPPKRNYTRFIDTDKGYSKIIANMKKIGKYRVFVGIRSDKGTQTEEAGGPTLAEIALFHEFGTPTIPQRSFLRASVDKHEKEYRAELKQIPIRILFEGANPIQQLSRLGLVAAGNVKKLIKSRIAPVLKKATIKRKTVNGKKGDVPLIDEGTLVNAIDFEVIV